MKSILSLVAFATLTTSLIPNINYYSNDHSTIKNSANTKTTPNVSKIIGLNNSVNKAIIINNTVWVGAGISISASGGLYKSNDNTNFTQVNSLNNRWDLCSLVADKSGKLYLTYGAKVFLSNDANKFESIKNPKLAMEFLAFNSKDVLYGAFREGLYKSTDGITYTPVYVMNNNCFIHKLIIAPDNTIYMLVSDEEGDNVYRSTDDGISFNKIPNIKMAADIAIDKDNTIYISNGGLYKSTDNGNNFNQITKINDLVFSNISLTPDGTLYIQTINDVWKLNSDNTVKHIWSFVDILFYITAAPDGFLWIGTFNTGLYKIWFT